MSEEEVTRDSADPVTVTVGASPLPSSISKPGSSAGGGLPLSASGAPDGRPRAVVLATPSVQGYQVIDRLGEGGMGTVWRAVQLSTRRHVALKIIGAAGLGSDRARLRFEREVELSARLDHPNIAKVFDGGLDRGLCFYAMELVEGVPLDRYVRDNHCTRPQILQLMRLICQAIQHAHQRGIIHRDLKPGNILVTVDGQPKVLDFGLAKAIEGDGGQQLSIDGEVAGTPAYMSPEQAAGHLDTLDTRSDVYTMGVILFRLLSGKFPHDTSGSYLDVMRRIAELEPFRLTALEPKADRELESLLGKALAKEPARRYGSAGELADDLGRYLDGEPLLAQPPTASYFLGKKLRKHRVPLTIAGTVVVMLVGMAIWSYVRVSKARDVALASQQAEAKQRHLADLQSERATENARVAAENARRADQSARQAAENEKRALAGERAAQLQSARSQIKEGDALANVNYWEDAAVSYGKARSQLATLGADPFALELSQWDVNRRCPPPLLELRRATGGWEQAVSFSPDGRLAASGGYGPIRVWELPTGRQIMEVGHKFDLWNFHCAVFSHDNKVLFTTNEGGTIFELNVETNEEIRRWKGHARTVHCMSLSIDGSALFTGGADGYLKVWDLASGKELLSQKLSYSVDSISPFPDGKRVLCGIGNAGAPPVVDLASGKTLYSLEGISAQTGLALSDDGTRICGGDQNSVRLWDAGNGHQLQVLASAGFAIRRGGVRILRDGRTAITCNTDGRIRTWDLPTGKMVADRGWMRTVAACAVSPDGRFVLSGDYTGSALLWGLAPSPELRPAHAQTVQAHNLAMSNDHRLVVDRHHDGSVQLWDFATGRNLGLIERDPTTIDVTLDPLGRSVIQSPVAGEVRWFDLWTHQPVRTIVPGIATIKKTAISADGRVALLCGNEGELKLWDIAEGRELIRAGGFAELPRKCPIGQAALSADGSRAVTLNSKTAEANSTPCAWDTTTGRLLWSYKSSDIAMAVAISPDGSRAAAGFYEGSIVSCRLASGPQTSSAKTRNIVIALEFTRDGQMLMAARGDGTVQFLDPDTLETVHSVPTDSDCWPMATSGDGQALATSGRSLRMWDFARTSAYRDWEPRLAHARRALADRPNDPWALAELAEWYAFRAEYQTAIDLAKLARSAGADVSPLILARCYWQCNLPTEAGHEFAEALARREAPELYLRLCRNATRMEAAKNSGGTPTAGETAKDLASHAMALARESRLEEAAAGLAECTQIEPTQRQWHYQLACLRLYLGDVEEYRQNAAEMQRLFGGSGDGSTIDQVVKTGLLMPGPDLQTRWLVELIDHVLDGPPTDPNRPWFELTKGLAEYRLGHFEQAIQVLGPWQEKMPRKTARATARLVLAMAHHRLGHAKEAAELLQAAEAMINSQISPSPTDEGIENWAICHILRREADSLIAGKSMPPPMRTGTYPATRPAVNRPQPAPIDLLALVDPDHDAVEGRWSMRDGALTSDDSRYARLRIPYEPPDEYDFLIEFERLQGDNSVSQIVSARGHSFDWLMDGDVTHGVYAFDRVGNHTLAHSPASIRAPRLENHRRYISLVQVRKDGVCAYLDGRLMMKWKTDFQDMSMAHPGGWPLPAFGLRTYLSPTRFRRIELYEIAGTGKPEHDK